MRARLAGLAIGILLSGAISPAGAADLTIGARAEPSLDPHFLFLSTTVAYDKHLYDNLVARAADGRLIPGLATSWDIVDDHRWRFHLRQGVRFHDGSPFTAADVVFSLERIPKVPNSPGPFTGNLKSIARLEVLDDHTIDVVTDTVNPQLAAQLPNVFIVSRQAVEGKETRDFATGLAAIGTGPFKFVSYTPGNRLVLRRNDDYWGPKPAWDTVTFRIIANDAAREAALLSGDVDLADFIPPSDVPALRRNPAIAVHTGPSNRVIYLSPNVGLSAPADITDRAGKPLPANPYRDSRVRQALALAINREALVSQVMDGLAIPASQLVPPGMVGYDPSRPIQQPDAVAAKQLLADAGYPDGFAATLHCTNNRYVNDGKVCQALGQMLARIGLGMTVLTEPSNTFFAHQRSPVGEYSLALVGWGSAGEADALWQVLHTYDKAKKFGAFNSSGYSNPAADAITDQALITLDQGRRSTLEKTAMALVMDDVAAIPLYYQTVIVATRKGIAYTTSINEYTLAMEAKPAE